MILYNYPFTDFPNGVNLDLLGRQIVDAIPAFGPAYLGSSTGHDVSISFDSALSGAEETELTAVVAAHDPTGYSFALNYNQDVYNASRRLLRNTWYAVKTVAGDLIYKVEETSYTYDSSGSYITAENVKTYSPLGAVMSDRNFTYETITNSDGSIFIRKSET
jgi:hypothetical protein